ncbi:hypothetical protein TFLX_03759 [Thermoflexales bacterium]|nr:hypothetical protein TFLX_03759 [Thermoflexales bacterium]
MKRWFNMLTILVVLALAACAPAATSTPTQPPAVPPQAPEPTQVQVSTQTPESTKEPEPTQAPEFAAPEGALVSVKSDTAPTLDGVADEATWAAAPATTIEVTGGANAGNTTAELKSLYSGDMVYFLLTYADPTESVQRSPWKLGEDGTWAKLTDPADKGGDNNVYYEDKFSMLWPINNSVPKFESVGCGTACHAGDSTGKPYGNKFFETEGATADLWHWKSIRNDGQLDDQYVDTQPYDKDNAPEAGRHSDKNDGGGYKDNQTEDKKLPAFAAPDNQPAPPYFILDSEKVPFEASQYKSGDEVAGIVKAPFKGDRGDISAGWKYAGGKWTLEFGRKLTTGSPTDVQFDDLAQTYYFGLAIFDNAQVRHAFQLGATPFVFMP